MQAVICFNASCVEQKAKEKTMFWFLLGCGALGLLGDWDDPFRWW